MVCILLLNSLCMQLVYLVFQSAEHRGVKDIRDWKSYALLVRETGKLLLRNGCREVL